MAEHFGVVHQLYNNAGIAFSRSVLESEYEDYERVLAVNLWGVIHGTKAFLPHLIASGDGHLVNVSSLNGYMAQSEMTPLLHVEVRGARASPSRCAPRCSPPATACASPSCTPAASRRTSPTRRWSGRGSSACRSRPTRRSARNTYNDKLLRMDPAQAAKIIVDGVEAGRSRILVGNDAKFVDALVRLLPSRYPAITVGFDKRLAR